MTALNSLQKTTKDALSICKMLKNGLKLKTVLYSWFNYVKLCLYHQACSPILNPY